MKSLLVCFSVFCTIISSSVLAQQEIRGEIIENIFTESFIDPSENFPQSPKSDKGLWAAYYDGYYYMEQINDNPRAIMALAKATNPDFYIKTKIMLGPASNNDQTIGVLFAVQPGGKGGLIFEFNRKNKFRVRDVGGNIITPDDGWVKCKAFNAPLEYNKIEIKCFRGRYECFVEDEFVFGFNDKRFLGGRFGLIIGRDAMAKMDFYSVYNLTIPGVPKFQSLEELKAINDSLLIQNNNLQEQLMLKEYDSENIDAIKAIKILEEQIEIVRIENEELKKIVTDYENNPTNEISNELKETMDFHVNKISDLSKERDSLTLLSISKEEVIDNLKKQLEDQKAKCEAIKNKVAELKNISETPKNDELEKEIEEDSSSSVENDKKEIEEIEEDEDVEEIKEINLVPLSELKIPVKKSSKKNY